MATKNSGAKTAITVLLGLAGVYLAAVFLFPKKVSAASGTGGGYVGGGYNGYNGYGSGYQATGQDSSTNSLLNKILNALGAQKKGNSGSGGTPSTGNTAAYGNAGSSMQTLADFVSAGNWDLANNNPYGSIEDSIFAGTDSLSDGGYSPMQTLDLNSVAQDFNPYADQNSQDYSNIYTDFAAGGDPSIPYDIIEGGSGVGDFADYSEN
jgi:hypothetical protein